MPEILCRKTAIEERRLQNRIACETTLNAGSETPASRLLLQIAVASYVVGIGMRIIYGFQLP